MSLYDYFHLKICFSLSLHRTSRHLCSTSHDTFARHTILNLVAAPPCCPRPTIPSAAPSAAHHNVTLSYRLPSSLLSAMVPHDWRWRYHGPSLPAAPCPADPLPSNSPILGHFYLFRLLATLPTCPVFTCHERERGGGRGCRDTLSCGTVWCDTQRSTTLLRSRLLNAVNAWLLCLH